HGQLAAVAQLLHGEHVPASAGDQPLDVRVDRRRVRAARAAALVDQRNKLTGDVLELLGPLPADEPIIENVLAVGRDLFEGDQNGERVVALGEDFLRLADGQVV